MLCSARALGHLSSISAGRKRMMMLGRQRPAEPALPAVQAAEGGVGADPVRGAARLPRLQVRHAPCQPARRSCLPAASATPLAALADAGLAQAPHLKP